MFIACLLFANSLAVTAQEYNLTLASFAPAAHLENVHLLEPWAQRVEEATNGRVKVTLYAGETLLKAVETYEGVVAGIADLGFSDYGYNMNSFPMLMTLFLGGLDYANGKVATYVARDFIEKFQPAEIQDTELMLVWCTDSGAIMSKTPVRTLDDFRGLQLKVSGKGVDIIEALGGTPVAMPMSEAVEGLQKGVIDGIASAPEILKGWNMTEVVDYVTPASIVYNAIHYLAMNKDTWNSFPEDIQEAISKVNEEFFEEVASEHFDKFNQEGLEYGIEHGDEVIELSEEELQRWIDLLIPHQQEYAQELNEKGLPGDEALQTTLDLIEKYNEEFK
jgi:TRAP-type C4-dicarboxylate transport system substrate-binding protein